MVPKEHACPTCGETLPVGEKPDRRREFSCSKGHTWKATAVAQAPEAATEKDHAGSIHASAIGRTVTWGKPGQEQKTGKVEAYVRAGSPISEVKIGGVEVRPYLRGAKVDGCAFEENRSKNARYLISNTLPTGHGPRWYAPRAKDIDAAIAAAKGT